MKLAIFDFDGTLIEKDTLPFLLAQWKAQSKSRVKYYQIFSASVITYLKYKLGARSKEARERMKKKAVCIFNSIFIGMTEAEVVEYLDKSSLEMIKHLDQSIVREIEKAKQDGFHTILLSGSYNQFLVRIAEYLEIDTVIGTPIQFKDGYYDSDHAPAMISGLTKVKRLEAHFNDHVINWEESVAYADSYSDLDILKRVGRPIVVRPDKGLSEIASQKNWQLHAGS